MVRLGLDPEKVRREEERRKLAHLIEEAKWNMYAEKWELAEKHLEDANDRAVSLRDKKKIEEILALLVKCRNKEKAEL